MLEKIVVEYFEFLIDKENNVGLALELDEGPIFNASFLYGGKNCAILIRNKKKAFWLPEIVPAIRETIMNAKEIMVIEKKGDEILKSYNTAVKHFDDIPYPDDFEKKMDEIIKEVENAAKKIEK